MSTTVIEVNPTSAQVQLTNREIEVLSVLAEGRTTQEAAELLFCSRRTVEFHLAQIYRKLEVSNRIQAMRRAIALGLLPDAA